MKKVKKTTIKRTFSLLEKFTCLITNKENNFQKNFYSKSLNLENNPKFKRQLSQVDLLDRSDKYLYNSNYKKGLNLINIDLIQLLDLPSKNAKNDVNISKLTSSTSQTQSATSLSSLFLDENGLVNDFENFKSSLKFGSSYRLRKLTEILFYLTNRFNNGHLNKSKASGLYISLTNDLFRTHMSFKNKKQILLKKNSDSRINSENSNSFSDMINYNSSNIGYNNKLKADTNSLNNGMVIFFILAKLLLSF